MAEESGPIENAEETSTVGDGPLTLGPGGTAESSPCPPCPCDTIVPPGGPIDRFDRMANLPPGGSIGTPYGEIVIPTPTTNALPVPTPISPGGLGQPIQLDPTRVLMPGGGGSQGVPSPPYIYNPLESSPGRAIRPGG